MATVASIGYGAALTYGGTRLAQVVDVKWKPKIDSKDVSNQDSPAVGGSAKNAWREKIPGLVDAGQITVNCVFKKAILTALGTLIGITSTWQLVGADAGATTFSATGFVVDWDFGIPVEDKETIDITIELTGAVTLS